MKRTMKHHVIIALVFLSACSLTSCTIYPDYDVAQELIQPDRIGRGGGRISALNDNVILAFPDGAVEEPITLAINEYWDDFDRNYFLKIVSIEPTILFNKPVMLTLRYDGDLGLWETIPEGLNLVIYYWDTKEDYQNQALEKRLACYLDNEARTVTTWINQSGYYAVGVVDQGASIK